MSRKKSYSLGKLDSSQGCRNSSCNTVCGDETVFGLTKNICPTIPEPQSCVQEEKETNQCRECKTGLAIDDQEAMWSEWNIGVELDPSSGIFKNLQIPMGWVDFKDFGRSGVCAPNNIGRMFADENCNTYQYSNYTLIIRNKDGNPIYTQDYHIPIIALEGPIQCECTNGSNAEPNNPEIDPEIGCTDENCNRMYMGAQCENGECKPTWLNLDDAIKINVEDTPSLDLSWDEATKTLKGDILTTDSNSIEMYVNPNGVGASLKIDPNYNNITEITTQGVYTRIVTGSGLTGAGTPTDPLRVSYDTEQCELCNGVSVGAGLSGNGTAADPIRYTGDSGIETPGGATNPSNILMDGFYAYGVKNNHNGGNNAVTHGLVSFTDINGSSGAATSSVYARNTNKVVYTAPTLEAGYKWLAEVTVGHSSPVNDADGTNVSIYKENFKGTMTTTSGVNIPTKNVNATTYMGQDMPTPAETLGVKISGGTRHMSSRTITAIVSPGVNHTFTLENKLMFPDGERYTNIQVIGSMRAPIDPSYWFGNTWFEIKIIGKISA